MGDLILNGRRYSGLIDAQGIFIDTDNVIVPTTSISGITTATYTATRDCIVCAGGVSDTEKYAEIQINGVRVWRNYNAGVLQANFTNVFLKKGQTISITNGSTEYSGSYTVYGIQTGDNVTFLSEYASSCYDTNEREVGCWVDGKPIYKKTFRFNSTILLTANGWTNGINVDTSNMETFVDFEVIRTVGAYATYGYLQLVPSNGLLNIFNARNLAVEIDTITLLYTKTTDTPGSGKLTPTEMPTVHYSTDEKVIGTWIDGKPLYGRTYEGTTSASSAVTVMIDLGTGMTIRRFDGTIGGRGLNSFYEEGHFNRTWIAGNGYQLAYLPNGSEFLSQPYNVTIQYTKTTD